MNHEEPTDPWGSFSPADWATLPAMAGRSAVEADVVDGRAVFYVQSGEVTIPDLALPIRAFHVEGEARRAVVVIQVEEVDGAATAGVRFLEGGNGICLVSELELVGQGQVWP